MIDCVFDKFFSVLMVSAQCLAADFLSPWLPPISFQLTSKPIYGL